MEISDDKDRVIDQLKRSSFRWKIVSALFALMTLVFLVYGFVQKAIASEKQVEATVLAQQAFDERKKANDCAEEAMRQIHLAIEMKEKLIQQEKDDDLKKALKK